MNIKTALTIAGSDCSGGAGIQADIKTMTMCGVYAMSVITALTAQNTTGVADIMEVTPDFLTKQLDMSIGDIPPDAVKTGMLSNVALINVIADKIKQYNLKNVVVDPVMVSTSGSRLIKEDAISTLTSRLFPLATVITPNIPEAQVLTNMNILNREDMEKAAEMMYTKFGCGVLLKGGHSISDANDYLFVSPENRSWIEGRRINNPNTHGTGCTLSSAIASYLALGADLSTAVKSAKEYISGALEAMLDLGHGSGPLLHNYKII